MYKKISQVLAISNYSISKEEWEEEERNNPDYPQIDALSDILKQLGVKNYIVKIPANIFEQLPTIFISAMQLQDTVHSCIISNYGGDFVEILFFNGKKIGMPKEEFLTEWPGILINIEDNQSKAFPDINIKKSRLANLSKTILIFQTVVLFVLWLYYAQSLNLTLLLLTNLAGLILSWSTFKVSLGFSNDRIERVCSLVKSGNCSIIIRSSESKVYNDLSLSDISLSYFLGSSLITAVSVTAPGILGLYYYLMVPMVGILIYALYQQSVVIKRKCLLCYGIILCSALQLILLKATIGWPSINTEMLVSVFLLILSLCLVLFVKDKLTLYINMKFDSYRMAAVYKNPLVFSNFLSNTPVFDVNELGRLRTLELNEKSRKNLIFIISPECSFCKEGFLHILKLTKYHSSDVSICISFQLNSDQDDRLFQFVERLYELQNTKHNLIVALQDYFLVGMSVAKWLKKWKAPSKIPDRKSLLYTTEFMLKNKLVHLPVVIVCGALYPSEYDTKDIKYFIEELFS